MKKLLFINPNKWGRGITPIWITSHFSVLKDKFDVKLFDCTFYSNWTDNEIIFNEPATIEELTLFHDLDYLKALKKAEEQKFFQVNMLVWEKITQFFQKLKELLNLEKLSQIGLLFL